MQQTKKDRNSCFLLRMRSCPSSEQAVAGLHPEPSWLQLLKREQTELKIHFKGQRHPLGIGILSCSLELVSSFKIPPPSVVTTLIYNLLNKCLWISLSSFSFLYLQILGAFLLSNVTTDSRQFQTEATVMGLCLGSHE